LSRQLRVRLVSSWVVIVDGIGGRPG
jgi:hypothetical protein